MKKDNFLDSQTLMAVLLVGATFVGWQLYMQSKYPDSFKKPNISSTAVPQTTPETPVAPSAPPAQLTQSAVVAKPEKLLHYVSGNLEFDISSRGMGLKNIKALRFQNRLGEIVILGLTTEAALPLETKALARAEPMYFELEQTAPHIFVGHAQLGSVKITKTFEIRPEKYVIDTKIVALGKDPQFTGLSTLLSDELGDQSVIPILNPDHEYQEFFIDSTDSKDRVAFGTDEVQQTWKKVKLASVGSLYFTQAILDQSEIMPEAKGHLNVVSKTSQITLDYPVLNTGEKFQLSYVAFIGPKTIELLRAVNPEMTQVVDFGFFNWLGANTLQLLKAFHGWVGNWGWAIILLTILVRIVVLPANIYSYKSMKAMQTIQPEIQALRERFKDDQPKQQQEMMALMKAHKVNPIGGCLPMLLQMPIFFALYKVLGSSIELYQAPFALWIHDLSLKDPYYILPVLMGITMFVQTKMTPTNMDPAQAKIMLMMPIIFTFFMVSLPSGLTLYMLVGAIFSVAQQTYFMRQSKTVPGAVVTGQQG